MAQERNDMLSLLEEDQAESSSWLEGTVHTGLKNYNEFVLLQGLSERPLNRVPRNNGSFVSSTKSQKLSQLELQGIFICTGKYISSCTTDV